MSSTSPEIEIKFYSRFCNRSDYGRDQEAALKPFIQDAAGVMVERYDTGPKIIGPAVSIEESVLIKVMKSWRRKYRETRFVLNVGHNLENPTVVRLLKWMLDAGGSGGSRLGDVSVISRERG